jgi:ParB family transcriptional regulator, chromosome partitioning protein
MRGTGTHPAPHKKGKSVISITNIPLSAIVTGLNNRTVFSNLDGLAESMRTVGLAQPITVRPVPGEPGKWQLVAGERRTRAAQLLGWEAIPAIVREMGDEEATSVMLAENTHRQDIDPIDEGTGYQQAIAAYGWSVAECARRANVTADRVQRMLALLNLLPDIQKLVRSGDLPRSHADALAALDHNRQIIALRVFQQSERKPTIGEFSQVCADLLAEQN